MMASRAECHKTIEWCKIARLKREQTAVTYNSV
jgi:hypothetical protein